MKRYGILILLMSAMLMVFAENGNSANASEMRYSENKKTLRSCPKNAVSVVVPYGVTSIGDYAFYRCSQLVSVVIPNSVTSIGNHAFSGCIQLTGVTIPDSVTYIGDHAFSGCSQLTEVTVPAETQYSRSSFPEGCKVTVRKRR